MLKILSDQSRFFIVSPFLELELIPKAIYNKRHDEAIFYRSYFDGARLSVRDTTETIRIARDESARCGLSAMDALLIASAHLGEADDFYTLESPEKPIFRTNLVHVVQLGRERS